VALRPDNAGSNTVADHVDVLTRAIAEVPAAYRKHMLVRVDGAKSSHGLLEWLTKQGAKRDRTLEYSVGFASTGTCETPSRSCGPRRGRPPFTPTGRCARAGTSPRSRTGWTRPVGRPGCA
jgi:hypothetical protein